MAVVRMLALTLIGPKKEMEKVASLMVLSGGFQPLPLDLLLKDRTIRSKITSVSENPYDELLVKLASIWQAAGEKPPLPMPIQVSPDFSLKIASMQINKIVRRLELWASKKEELSEKLERLEAILILMRALKERSLNLEDLFDTKYLVPIFAKASDDNFRRLVDSSEEAPLLIEPLLSRGGNTWFLGLTAPGYEEGAQKLLESLYCKKFSLKDLQQELRGNVEESISKRIENLKRAISGLEKASSMLLEQNREYFINLYSTIYTMQRVYELCRGRGELKDLYILSGWIPEDILERVRPDLERLAPQTVIHVEEVKAIPYSGIKVPTLLKNLPFVRAFQDVVALYSLPSYGEMDPSFLVAITFCLFFGFMFGDVGHGAMLFVIAAILQKKKVLSRSMGIVLKSAGVSSALFGFLYGSMFGIEGIIHPLWISPMEDMGDLLGFSIGIGVSILTLGMVLNMIIQYRAKDFGRLLFDGRGLAGAILYLSLAAMSYATFKGIPLPGPKWVYWSIPILLFLVILFRDILARVILRKREKEEEKLGLYVFEVFHNLLSFLSNTASFVRLAAFALNHVGLSLAVMMLSDMVRDLPGGLILKGTLLVLGNVLIVGLEGLIVFIQTLRLEYYEFFGKFYRGGGKAFRPVTFEGKMPFRKSRSVIK
ncbi:V-type ATPase 116kDa subunit family protein [Thermovirga sp.]|nr:V-type ATPase 116kDa subunit family protein [Thermovirga sp.]MCD6189042.1 hypothetical protein [Thermococcus sp.]